MEQISSEQIIENIRKAGIYYQEIMSYLLKNKLPEIPPEFMDSEKNSRVISKITKQLFEHPEKFAEINIEYLLKLQNLIQDSVERFIGRKTDKQETAENDRRFRDSAWQKNIYFDFIRQYYQISTSWLKKNIEQYDLDSESKNYLQFATEQFVNALSPSNFIFSNPEVIRESIDTGMGNIASGMRNFLNDLKNSGGFFKIPTTDKSYFELGKNLATCKGKVIYQNDLAQLICYEPKDKTYQIPIFIIPPWINKYYILDLSENNSFIKWLQENNFQVFLVSWVNPDKKLAHKDFEDYLKEGILEPYKYLQKIGVKKVNVLGYCIGGTLLAMALAYWRHKKQNFINSATFLTTLIDFSTPGDIGAFINRATLSTIEKEVSGKGYLDGSYISNSFSLIRANDLVWSFFVNNYLLGKRPSAFDILYWNSDSTNLPAKMYIYYVKNMYIENNLIKPGVIELLGVKIDLSAIEIPAFAVAAKSDHIALWKGVYNGFKLLGSSDKTFCLTEAGHVAGIINPASSNKYSHSMTSDLSLPADEAINHGNHKNGSWWHSWQSWIIPRSGKLVKSIDYRNLHAIEPAPGSYVMKSF